MRDASFPQVEFRVAAVEALPFPDTSFEVALSNGVLNLIPDKPAAPREIFRVLRLGGRLQACDMGLVGEEVPPDKALWSDYGLRSASAEVSGEPGLTTVPFLGELRGFL